MAESSVEEKLTRNIRLYPWYQAASSFLPWLPIFFLYFNQYVSLSEALRLGAIYYFAVFVFEVPSGYLSDRMGRRVILLASTTMFLLAYIAFLSASDFTVLVIAQIVLAAAVAFQSGSDSALLYDTLAQLNRESEYGSFEASGRFYAMVALAVSSLIGGVLGTVALYLPYALGVAAALVCWSIVWRLYEPTVFSHTNATFVSQLGACLNYFRDPVLLWLSLFYLLTYALAHVPYEFYQPYIRLLDASRLQAILLRDSAPLIAGVVTAVSMSGGAIGAAISTPLQQRISLGALLLLAVVLQCLIIGGMSAVLHPLILLPIMCRGFPMAMVHGPMMGAIGPRLDSTHRATFLSLQSLIVRVGFGVLLYALSVHSSADPALSWPTLSPLLIICLMLGLAGVSMLALTVGVLRDSPENVN